MTTRPTFLAVPPQSYSASPARESRKRSVSRRPELSSSRHGARRPHQLSVGLHRLDCVARLSHLRRPRAVRYQIGTNSIRSDELRSRGVGDPFDRSGAADHHPDQRNDHEQRQSDKLDAKALVVALLVLLSLVERAVHGFLHIANAPRSVTYRIASEANVNGFTRLPSSPFREMSGRQVRRRDYSPSFDPASTNI